MRAFASRTFIPLLCLFLLPAVAQESRQDKVIYIGVAQLANHKASISATDARDELVQQLNSHHLDRKLDFTLKAVAVDSAQGSSAIAEGRRKGCQFVLYMRVEALEKSSLQSSSPKANPRNSSQKVEVDTALLEYQLRRIADGAPYSIGIAKSRGSESVQESILDAIAHLPNKIVADLANPANSQQAALSETTPTEPVHLNSESNPGANSCAWLPKDIRHAESLRRVCEYAETQHEYMPNFMCEQETARYIDHHRVPTDFITATIRYVDGEESYRNLTRNGRPLPDAMWNTAGLWSSGQLEGNLRSLFDPSNRAAFAFAGESKIGNHLAWLFTYRIKLQYEPLWQLRGDDQMAAPPYEGELWVDQKSGIVLRFRSTAVSLPAEFPIRAAQIVTDFDNVVFPDNTRLVLPVESTTTTRYRDEPPTRNIVEFRDCRRFRATTRMILDASGDLHTSEHSIAANSELGVEEYEKIFDILREDAVEEDEVQHNIEQRQELNAATGAAFWKMAQLEKEREKLATAKRMRPPTSYEIVSNSNGTATFRVNVELVPVSIVVRDNKGHAVGGLKQEDFQLLDDRKAQEIVTFAVEQGPNSGDVQKAQSPGESASAAPNSVAYVFDDLHSASLDLTKAKVAAERHLNALLPGDHAAIYTTSGEVTLDLTGDREKLKAALRRVKSHMSASPSDCPAMTYFVADLIVNVADESAMQKAMEDALECTFPDGLSTGASLGGSTGRVSAPNIQGPGALQKSHELVLAKAYEVATLGRMESDRTLGCCMKFSTASNLCRAGVPSCCSPRAFLR